ncbi:hypothetical protein pEaSNUABM9_00096 [Erwinia phage pEa_SNUABM_9]|nr:hypothetical protein pEaSNUABM9_00096 [Erwinia phage pEa_SNUABM_9]
MYQIVDIVDIMTGEYDHCQTWKDMELSTKAVLDLGRRYKNTPILVWSVDGIAQDFQFLELNGDKLFIYLREPFTEAVSDELKKVLHLQPLVEKNAVFAVVDVEFVSEEYRADMVSMKVPDEVRNNPAFQKTFGELIKYQPEGTDMIVVVPYTEDAMAEMLPMGWVIMDYVYSLD